MNAWSIVLELPGVILGPLVCRLRGHRWWTWPMHTTTLRLCTRCGRSA